MNADVLITIADLAARWGVGSGEAIQIVRREAVPFVSLGSTDQYVRWSKVRFKLADVEAWEERRSRTFRPSQAAVEPPRARRPAGGRLGPLR